MDNEDLQANKTRVELEKAGVAPKPSPFIVGARAKCLDPEDQDHRGIRKNLARLWKDAKEKHFRVSIHSDYCKKDIKVS